MVDLQDVPDGDEVPQRLGHLFVVHLDEAVVEPVPREGLPRGALGLGDLVFVVREDQVLAAAVNVEGLAQEVGAHDGALDVPARPPPAPGAVPPGLPFLARLPEGEVEGVLLLLARCDAGPRHHLVEVAARELSVILELLHGKVDVAAGHGVGQAVADEPADELDHARDVLRGPRRDRGPLDAEPAHVLVVLGDVALGDLPEPHPLLVGLRDDLVVHVGIVLDVGDPVAPVAQVSGDDVEVDGGARMADVAGVVDRDPAGVDPHLALLHGDEVLLPPCQRVVETKRHGLPSRAESESMAVAPLPAQGATGRGRSCPGPCLRAGRT